ncbi:MAG: hypothetical protein Q4C95_07650 [Planctomycetia bacterium]|nr:hypothetical protein [Planctomycetia bacterium]
MSSEQRLDPTLVEQTKQQIRVLVSEISQISKTDIAPEEFHSEFLPRVISALAAVGGAVWTLNPNGQLALGYQVNLQQTKLHENEEANKQHSRLLYKMLNAQEESNIVPAHSGSDNEDEAGNPTDFLLLFGVIKTELETFGLVEVVQRSDTNPATQKGYLRFLQQMTGLASEFYKNRQLRNFGDRQNLWIQLEDFTRNIHKTLDYKETIYTVVNESRRLIECDRVSIAIKRGKKCRVEAVSGQAMLEKRSTTLKLLGRLATAVVACDEPITYVGDTTDFAPQVETAVEEYVDEAHSKMVAVFPLARTNVNAGDSEETDQNKLPPEPPFGAIIIEQIEDNRVPEKMRKRIEIVVEHAKAAIGNALDHNNIILMPLWKTIGKSKVLVTARMLPKTIAVSIGVLALFLAMIIIPWNFNMHCKGTLEPEIRRNIFASEEGKVEQVFVRHGSVVYGPRQNPDPNDPDYEKGTILVRLSNNQLEADIQKVEGDIAEVKKVITNLSESSFKPDDPSEKLRIMGELSKNKVRLESLLVQRAINEERKKELEIRSPITGTVMTFDLVNKLQSRPVQRGVSLMEIAEPQGKLILELDMPEKNMGYIDEYLKKIKEKDPNSKLKVHFVMMVDSTQTYTGKVIEEHDRAENRGTQETTVRIRANIDDPDQLPPSKRAGAGVSAKIYCGKRALGFVLFHEVVSYLQKTVFFWFQ